MKMYIAVLDEFPDHMAPTLVAHAVLSAHLEFSRKYIIDEIKYKDYLTWLEQSFKKCVVRVNRKEFEKIGQLPDIYSAFEKYTLDGRVSCYVVMPRKEIPNVLKFAKLWDVKKDT
jgi:hypothetical protein